MATEHNSEVQFISTAPAFAICGVCDEQYPSGTQQCANCKSPLSLVRKCPKCERIVSAKHQRCVYCSTSFIQEESAPPTAAPKPVPMAPSGHDPVRKRRAILVSIAVFLVVMFAGLYANMRKIHTAGPEIAASSYLLHNAALKLQPNDSAGTSTTLDSGTVVSLTGIALDPEGHRWYVLRTSRGDEFLKVTDVAPPKVRLPELGSQMLRAWLLTLREPDLIADADSAVTYFCNAFPASPHCSELQLLAAEQFRSVAQRTGSAETLERARHLYQTISNTNSPEATEAARALESLAEPSGRSGLRRSRTRPAANNPKDSSYGSGHEYALVDRAEVHVNIPDLNALGKAQNFRTQIANEIRIHGKVAVPSNATCILKVSEVNANKQVRVQLTAIEFGNHHYDVSTAPQTVSSRGATVVFPLESSLLIGR